MSRFRPLARVTTALAALTAVAVGAVGAAPTARAATPSATPKEKLVALGEESLLADLLDLGIPVAASTANVAEQGFQGVAGDTSGIEIFTSTELKLEQLAALEPDHIVVTDFWLEHVPRETLEGLAEKVTVVDTGSDWRDDYVALAKSFGKQKLARKHLKAYNRKVRAARTALGADRTVSLTAVYPGGNVAIWVGDGTMSADVLGDLGVELVPSDAGADPDSQGRVYVSLERLDLLQGDDLVLLYSPQIEGETASLSELRDSALWKSIPAVAGDRVVEIDRLGYNGIAGRAALVDELREQLAD